MKHNQPNNVIRQWLFGVGVFLYRVGLARFIIGLSSKRVRALLYHAVEPHTSDWTEGLGVNITPEEFAANLDYFEAHYNVIDVMDVAAGKIPPRPLVITFDDGYQSVATHAAPALVQRNMPATVYLITQAVNGQLVWVNLLNRAMHHDPHTFRSVVQTIPELSEVTSHKDIVRTVQEQFEPQAIQALCQKLYDAMPRHTLQPDEPLYMDRATIKALQQDNIHFGFHTRDHYNMGLCTPSEVEEQLNNTDLQDYLDSNTFAYPFGYFNQHAINGVQANGYERIMTVGNNNQRFSALHLDRIEVFTANPAHVFAHIEVVEPIIAHARRLVLTMKGRYNTDAPAHAGSASPE